LFLGVPSPAVLEKFIRSFLFSNPADRKPINRGKNITFLAKVITIKGWNTITSPLRELRTFHVKALTILYTQKYTKNFAPKLQLTVLIKLYYF